MDKKFKNIPLEEDTRVLSRTQIAFGPHDAIHEKWKWVFEGVSAESVILLEADVAALTNEELTQQLKASSLLAPDSPITISRGKGNFTFLNFNFVVGGPPGEWKPEVF